MKLFIKKSSDIQIALQIEVDLGNGFESYETENLITNGLELSDDTDFSKIKVRYNNKILENIDIIKKLEIKNVPVGLSKSTVFPNCYFSGDYVIPEGVTSIGQAAFYECTSLTSVVIPISVTSIGDYAFSVCTSLTSVVIPSGVTSIGNYAFYGCSSLTNVVIPEGVTSIRLAAFYECTSLTSVVIPDSVTSIDNYAFYSCSRLATINYTGTEEQWNSISKGYRWNYKIPSNCQIIFDYVR